MLGPSCSRRACPLDEGEVDSDSAGVDGVFGECIGEVEMSIPLVMEHRGRRERGCCSADGCRETCTYD